MIVPRVPVCSAHIAHAPLPPHPLCPLLPASCPPPQVPRVEGDFLLNTFLMLPTDALAILSAEFEFEP